MPLVDSWMQHWLIIEDNVVGVEPWCCWMKGLGKVGLQMRTIVRAACGGLQFVAHGASERSWAD